MNTIPRRTANLSAWATAATLLAKVEAVAERPELAAIQTLVSELRSVGGEIPASVWFLLQEVADKLEALPGIVPVKNEHWQTWKSRIGETRTGPGLPRRHLTPARIGSKGFVCTSAQADGPGASTPDPS